MKLKRAILVTLLLVFLTIGAVSASDDNSTSNYLTKDTSNEILNANETAVFSDITELIDATPSGGTLELDEDFAYDDFSSGGVVISKSITIDGKGHTLDSKKKSRMIRVEADNVVLKNMVFKNGYVKNDGGGAISIYKCSGCVISNCTFIDCYAYYSCSGAIEIIAAESPKITYCNITDSTFTNCRSSNGGGAVYIASEYGDDGEVNCNIKGCSFTNCYSDQDGGAILIGSELTSNCSIEKSNFINCYVAYYGNGGAISFGESKGEGVIKDCYFTGCSADIGGAVYIPKTTTIRVINSNFEKNQATETGAAISGGLIFDCVFNKNTSPESEDSNNPSELIPKELTPTSTSVFVFEFPEDAEGTLEVFMDGVRIEVITIINGIATIDLSQYKGTHTISFVYSGDANYPSFEKDSIYISTKITAGDISVVYMSGKKYTITVFESPEVLAKEKTPVIFKIKNSAVTLYTNANGIASYKISQTPGTYKVTITSLDKSVTKTIKVKHLLSLKSATVKRSAKKLVLQATLAKLNGKYLKNKKITFKFNGKKYTAKTNKKGVAKVTIKKAILKKLKAGKKITYQATYSKDTIKKTAKVKK